MDEATTQALAQPIVNTMFSMDKANTLLVSSLVKHLVDEGIIDLDKYLESNKNTEEAIKENILRADYANEDDETEEKQKAEFVGYIFSMHRNDFAKPE